MPAPGVLETKPRPVRGFVVFKWTVYALLAANVALFGTHGTANEQLDTAAWVVLLLLFEWETGGWRFPPAARRIADVLRVPAAGAVAWACATYARQREWLDFANACTWIGVVLLLELDLRMPRRWRIAHHARALASSLCYLALGGCLLAWLVLGLRARVPSAWLDAWDALLWLVAFVAIELNLFGLARRVQPAPS